MSEGKEQSYLTLKTPENTFDSSFQKFTEDLDKIRVEIDPDNKDFQNDKLAFKTQRAVLGSVLSILPQVIKSAKDRPTQGSIYALTNLITQIIELFGQLRSSEALENQVEHISEMIISPMLKDIITTIFDKAYYIKQKNKTNCIGTDYDKINSSLDSLLVDIAPIFDTKKSEAEEKLSKFLLEI